MPSKYFIYALVDPRSKQWRYIGKSTTGMRRPKEHDQESNLRKSERTHKACWIRQLKRLGLAYNIEILEELDAPDRLYEVKGQLHTTAGRTFNRLGV